MNKKLITIAEIVFAIAFIILMAKIFGTVNGFGNTVNNQLVNIQLAIDESDMISYDNSVVSGDSVRSMINNMKETKNGIKLSYLVANEISHDSYGYGGLVTEAGNTAIDSNGDVIENLGVGNLSSNYSKYDISTQVSKETFINPVDKYESHLVFNQNGALIGVIFNKVVG